MPRFWIASGLALGLLTAGGAVYLGAGSAAEAKLAQPARAPSVMGAVTPSAEARPPALAAGEPTQPAAPSPESVRIEQRRLLYETVDALLSAAEFARARALLDDDERRNGSDSPGAWQDLEQGYRVIADCLQEPTPASLTRGQSYLLVSQGSPLAAKIRAACQR